MNTKITPLLCEQPNSAVPKLSECRQDAHYRVAGRVVCRKHLAARVDEVAGDWDGSLVPVERLGRA